MHLVGCFYNYITMHEFMNLKSVSYYLLLVVWLRMKFIRIGLQKE